MAHDVFISYSSKDKPAADATCAVLESKGIRCWIAPRDIAPGSDWGEVIVDAIHASRAVVLVFSENANLSNQIKREVERAVNAGLPVIPLRIENVMPARSLEYFLSTPHWLDAFTPPLEKHLNYLADVIRHILDQRPVPVPPAPHSAPRGHIRRRILIGGLACTAGVVAILGWLWWTPSPPPTFTGAWTADAITVNADAPNPFGPFSVGLFVQAAVEGGKLTGSFTVDRLNQYKYQWAGDDTGTVAVTAPGSARLTSDITHRSTVFSTIAMSAESAAGLTTLLGGKPGDGAIAITAAGTAQSALLGTPQGRKDTPLGPLVGHWSTHTPPNGLVGSVTTSLDIGGDGRYHYHFAIDEAGIWQAADGKWTRTPQGAPPTSGTYTFSGNNQVSCAAATGVTVWRRVAN